MYQSTPAPQPPKYCSVGVPELAAFSKKLRNALLKEQCLNQLSSVLRGRGFTSIFSTVSQDDGQTLWTKTLVSRFSLGFIIRTLWLFFFPTQLLQLWVSQSGCRGGAPAWAVAATLLTAGWSSVVSPSRRRACKRWRTGPRAGWLCGQSRQTPTATGSCRATSWGATVGCGGMWQNVPSACRRGEPARRWAGRGTLRSWDGGGYSQNQSSAPVKLLLSRV